MADATPFRRVAIIGTGLIGGSFGLALRKHFAETRIVGFDRPDVAAGAVAKGATHECAQSLPQAVQQADLIYVALPVIGTIEALPAIAAAADSRALVTDAASTKAVICRVAQQRLGGSGARFVGGHPMAGQEISGIENASADLFCGSRYALIGREHDFDARADAFVSLLKAIGAEPVWCDAETHDWAVGIVSHLPQLAAIALAHVVQDETDETGLPVNLSGRSLRDMLRVAGSPYSMWRDVCLTNSENIAHALDRLTQAIDYLRTHLASKELEEEFLAANEVYKTLRELQ
jgi:prephenate dehydrogenase